MVLAAVLAYALSAAAHLPGGYWAVLSAVIVSRPLPGVAFQVGAGRLLGTVAGAGFGILASCGRLWHLPEPALIAGALLPLAVVIICKPGWRTAPIAAIIVLSASPLGHSSLAAGLFRIAEVALGAVTGVAVTWLLLPTRSDRAAVSLCAAAHGLLLAALDAALAADTARSRELQARARQHLGALANLRRTAHWERIDKAFLARLHATLARLALSVGFATRALLGAHQGTNPIVATEALRTRLAELSTGPVNEWPDWSEVCAALPCPHHREQAQALGYALTLVNADAAALSCALGLMEPAS